MHPEFDIICDIVKFTPALNSGHFLNATTTNNTMNKNFNANSILGIAKIKGIGIVNPSFIL